MRSPSILGIDNVIFFAHTTRKNVNGRWVPSRPEGFGSWRYRLRAAWLVWTGKADALVWDDQ